jgi:hypothetical protein
MVADPAWRSKLWKAGLVLLIPGVGWPALLGYRKKAVFRLASGTAPILPDWEEGLGSFTRGGHQAMGVIHAYLSPLYLWFLLRVVNPAFLAGVPWGAVLLFFLVFPIFSMLILPAGLVYARWRLPELDVSAWELYAMAVAFPLVVFFIPAGFLNVTRTRRMLSAFDVPQAVWLIARHPRRYVEAWVGSSLLSLLGHFCVPFSPWGVAWCYLGITYLFNEVPHPEGGTGSGSPFDEFRHRYWQGFRAIPRGPLLIRYEPLPGVAAPWPRSPFTVVRPGPFEVPFG